MRLNRLIVSLLTLALIGCTASQTATQASDRPDGSHGCDAFEQCEDGSGTENGTSDGTPAGTDTAPEERAAFKTAYESLNGTQNKSEKVYRTVTVPEDHPFKEISVTDAVSALKNGESFYLYVGDPKCPWCRAVLETACAKAKEYGIQEIRTLTIWDAEGNEILRDKYRLEDGKPVKVSEGAEGYADLLDAFDSLLDEYELTNDAKEKIAVGEKRIYAPTYFRIDKGTAVRATGGYGSSMTDPWADLTEEMLKEEQSEFDGLFGEQ